MDSGSKTPPQPTTNGGGVPHKESQHDLSQVLQALEAIYNPRSSNDTRQQASAYLEQAKRLPEAPAHGFELAFNKSQPPALRHYGLSMLEYSIKYGWEDYTEEQGDALRQYVVQLAQNIAEEDPVYLRNKVAQLWTEIAKRSWGAEWMDMDNQLVELWETSIYHQGVVIYVLEMLSEEVFNREDTTAGLRGNDLGRACVEIFTPAAVLAQHLPGRDTSLNVKFGDDGWLKRLCDLLNWCLSNDYERDERVRSCAIKILNALKAAMAWVIPKAIAATQCVEHVCKALAVPVVPLQQAAVEVLYAIYSRSHLHDDEFVEIVCPMFTPGSVSLLREVYGWTLADMNINDLNEQKYALCKKLSELSANLGNFIEQKPQLIAEGSDLPGMFTLLFDMLRNPSLVVSIPILHCWTKLLRSRIVRDSDVVNQMIGGLLETCCSRLIRYEALPEDSEDTTLRFLNEDIDTFPERHAFLGNYRRYCEDIIEITVRRTPVEAMQHIFGQADALFQNLYGGLPPFQAQNFSKHATSVLRVDAQVTVINASLKGYLKWLSTQGSDPQKDDRDRNIMQDSIEQWCRNLLNTKFEDPEIAKKVVQLLVTFSTKALPERPAFALNLLEYILNANLQENPDLPQYSDAVKDLERICSVEMQKLAMMFPEEFMGVYDDLECKINSILSSQATDDRQRMAFTAFLFIIVHRSTTIDRSTQEARMKQMLSTVKEAWQADEFTKSLLSFPSFCEMLGMGRLPEFFSIHNFHNIQDWSTQALDSEGQAMQTNILERPKHLPLRLTKTLLAASTEKLREGSQAYDLACILWADAIPTILPNLLQLINHAQAFNNIDNWAHLPEELQQVIRKVLTDRFWQAGISTESRDDFFARVSGSKSTYEGFASTVRGTVRQIRETSYYILWSLTRFRDFFYGISDLPMPLSQALYGNAHALSAHHLSVLLSVSTQLIEGCPANLRAHFLPPMVAGLFRELDRKITTEWDAINKQISESGEHDNLSDEMKTESILRQLTYSAVSFVSQLLDQQRPDTPTKDSHDHKEESIWRFILSTPQVLEPILLFCKNTIRVRDTRCVGLVVRVLRTLIPRFKDKSPIRDFYCIDILQAAITSLHEPYFVDVQKDLASLIAAIIHLDEDIPRSIIMSLPGMPDKTYRVDRKLSQLRGANRNDDRVQRSIVLDLLSSVRGVSIHEQGRIERSKPKRKSTIQEQYMSVDEQPAIVRGTSAGLDGVANMFE
ncbi:ARM repeat-containing protein [Lepidopterella palustris CBS 459.81]|uniref:ARM repeat-containing protein n=1 Tax=Lepidopterella palustris CBS 459.81 TaxID=1314670 RepID=A0A8E2EC85_9PEZI|nr:ARM repeat-containing protein [Lepidopterella palustris CBS 459.81]